MLPNICQIGALDPRGSQRGRNVPTGREVAEWRKQVEQINQLSHQLANETLGASSNLTSRPSFICQNSFNLSFYFKFDSIRYWPVVLSKEKWGCSCLWVCLESSCVHPKTG